MANDDFTPVLGMPYLLPNQAQKHVTVNESLGLLDAVVQAAVIEVGRDAPPEAPEDGVAFAVGTAPQGDFIGRENSLAVWQDGRWVFHSAREGWRIWSVADREIYVFSDGSWRKLLPEAQRFEALAIATETSFSVPFTARLNMALWTAHETADGGTGDIRVSINKEVPSGVASLIFQTGYSGRTELGTVGDDGFSIRTSDDGAIWNDALYFEPVKGRAGMGGQPEAGDQLTVHGRLQARSDDGYFLIRDDGTLDMARNDGGAIFLRSKSAGSVINFAATNTAGVTNQTVFSMRPDNEDILVTYSIAPRQDGVTDLGRANSVWRDIYLQNAPTVSSDRRGKVQIDDLMNAPQLLEFLRPVSYRRTADGARHFGFIAQDVREALLASGHEDAAVWQLSDKANPDSQQALRQEELIAVLVSCVQSLQVRLDGLERVRGEGVA
jgi:hypothetical protein